MHWSILIADDDEAGWHIMRYALDEISPNLTAHFVKDGSELLEYLKQSGSNLPNLVFMDIYMPNMDGITTLKHIRTQMNLHIPIIIFSGSMRSKDIGEAYSNGANGYITKPMGFGGLVHVLRNTLEYWSHSAVSPHP